LRWRRQPPSATEKLLTDKFYLYIGMSVNNSATELCITKGQEGTIAGWKSIKGLHRKLVLDTLFVKLNNSLQLVKFNGLPENVVLIIKSTISISFKLASGWYILISREQVKVLPNFAMTDYTF